MNEKARQLVNDRAIKKVAILGAGASADAGAPVISNFWNKTDELIAKERFNEDEIKKINNIKQKRKELLPDSDIEEFFSYVDFQIHFDVLIPTPAFGRDFIKMVVNKRDKDWIPIPEVSNVGNERDKFYKLKKDISWLITKTLDESLKDRDQGIEECYIKLIRNFDVVISFNWDLLYEHSFRKLKGVGIPAKNLGFGKGFYRPSLLKLHGSIDWGRCKQCNGLHMSDKVEHIVYGQKCPTCKSDNLTTTHILPVLTKFENISKMDKTEEYPPYRNIWRCAMYALTEAQEIYFLGYSLSDNDAHAKIFLKSAIFKNIDPNLKIYVIYKKDEENPDNDSELKKRYHETFKKRVKPIFIEKSFKDYFTNNYR
jgi:NAD-dependent SIR2 family protein deacetylase